MAIWKFLIPSTASLKIAGIVLASAGLAGAAFFAYTRGQDRGFQNAYSQFQTEIQQLNEDWKESIIDRDSEIESLVSNEFSKLDEQIRTYVMNDQAERELISRLDVLSSTLEEMRNESATTDFGNCQFSPEFERLLNTARESITGTSSDQPAPSP